MEGVEMAEKKIEVVEMNVADLKKGFGNPRKIKRKNEKDLEKSLDDFGDFGVVVIDEKNNIIAGNQRCTVMLRKDPNAKVLCKRLVGYSEAELRAINLKDNTHAGEWDLDMLADWTADLNIDLGIKLDNKDTSDRTIPEMELVNLEKYDYVLICCKTELDYELLTQKLDLAGKVVPVAKRKLKARAIWYDKIADQILSKEEAEKYGKRK